MSHTITRRTSTMLAAALVGIPAYLLATAQHSEASEVRTQAHVRQYPQCPTEDSALCVWRNQGPGFSFVSGPNRDPAPRVFRVSNRIADALIRRDNWRHAPEGSHWDLVHPTPSGQSRITAGPRTVMSIGDTTYVITLAGKVASS